MTILLDSLSLRTVGGKPFVLALRTPGDGRLLADVVVDVDGKTVTGSIDRAYPVLTASSPENNSLRARGAAYFARLYGGLIIALDEAEANAINTANQAGHRAAEGVKVARYAAMAADIRASKEVRRVLSNSPGLTPAWTLTEAYQSVEAERICCGIPGHQGVEVDRRCPSLRAVCDRSSFWGCFAGHNNSLRMISDDDWHLLVAETGAVQEQDRVAAAVRTQRDLECRGALLKADVPAQALQAYTRWGGDAERAWEHEDETGAGLILRHGSAIEAQGLARSTRMPDLVQFYPPGA